MLKLESLTASVAIAETGSVVAAGRHLGISKPAISERLADLDRFVQRTTRRLWLTQGGAASYARAHQILRDVDLTAIEVVQLRGTLGGPLRLSAPVSFGTLQLGPRCLTTLAPASRSSSTTAVPTSLVASATRAQRSFSSRSKLMDGSQGRRPCRAEDGRDIAE